MSRSNVCSAGRFQRRGHVAGGLHLVALAVPAAALMILRRVAVVFHQEDPQRASQRLPSLQRRSGCRVQHVRTAAVQIGSRTVKVAPLPLPSLWASMVPPCISTRALLMASPSPRPPNCRVIARLGLLEGIEDAGPAPPARCPRRCR